MMIRFDSMIRLIDSNSIATDRRRRDDRPTTDRPKTQAKRRQGVRASETGTLLPTVLLRPSGSSSEEARVLGLLIAFVDPVSKLLFVKTVVGYASGR